MTKKKIIELLKSGKFTIRYDDNQSCVLVPGRHNSYEASSKDECKNDIEFDGWSDGYVPVEVEYLVEALGGKVVSI